MITNQTIGGAGGGHTQGTDTALGTLPTKDTPIDADKVISRDSEAGDALKTSTWTQIKAFFRTSFDAVYSAFGHGHSDLSPAHKDAATGVHNVGAGTIAKTSDIPSNVIDLTFIIDGGGSAISTGQKGHLEIPFACTITGWTILADQSGSIVVDVWKDTYANFPPTVADTIAGSEKPTLSSVQKNQDLTLTTWTTAVSAGDILAFNVDSVATVTRVTLSIRAEKS